MIKKEVVVEKTKKLHTFLQDFGFSYADVNKIIRNKDVKVNGKVEKENIMLQIGDSVTFYYSENMLTKKYEIVFDGKEVLVIYKFAGIESAGEKGLEKLLKAIAVHRLDRNTEGLMVFAKDEEVAKKLKNAFKNRKIHKFYVAEVVGKFDTDKIYQAHLVKNSEDSFVKIYSKSMPNSMPISTKIQTIKSQMQSSVVKVELLTGKTHQIRAHLAYLGHPIIGDEKYGKSEINKKFSQNHQKLACFMLKFDFLDVDELNFKEFIRYPKWLQNCELIG